MDFCFPFPILKYIPFRLHYVILKIVLIVNDKYVLRSHVTVATTQNKLNSKDKVIN